ncbi:MAG: DUF4956 domain-containing protein [Butyricicoccus sp.]|nr:DUF4956 domain-containing protein [Butyricicoccus sp.]MBQ8586198.1 DUF4956 domain-containing protein [Butyricicoccus sp.]
MTFNDIFKSSFLEGVTSFSLVDTALALLIALVLGLFISVIYQKTFRGVLYSPGFAVSLVGMCMITTLVILAVTSNVVLSLGMVGALSIVRFRAAIKEPLDIVYLFWAMTAGIVTGAGLFPMAIIGSVIIGVVLLVFANRKQSYDPYLLILSCATDEAEKFAFSSIEQKYVVKSKTVGADGIEVTAEIRLPDMTTEFVNKLAAIEGVRSAVLVSYNGDYLS